VKSHFYEIQKAAIPVDIKISPNNRMQSDFGKLRLPQPLMRSVMCLLKENS